MQSGELEKITNEEYQREHALAPTSSSAYFGIGYGAMVDGQLEKAKIALQKSIELDPENTLAYQILGIVYADTEDNEKAISCFNTCIELVCKGLTLDIEEENPYFHKAWCLEDIGKLAEAEKAYQEDITYCPLHYNGYFRLAKLYHQQANFGEAERIYQKALDVGQRYTPVQLASSLFRNIEFNLERARNKQAFEDYPTG